MVVIGLRLELRELRFERDGLFLRLERGRLRALLCDEKGDCGD